MQLIESISAPEFVLAGEPAKVELKLARNVRVATVAIAGQEGDWHILQAPATPGTWQVPVRAVDEHGNADQQKVAIEVREHPAGRLPQLRLERDPFLPYGVVVSLNAVLDGAREYLWKAGEQVVRSRVPVAAFDLADAIDHRSGVTIVPVEVAITTERTREPLHLARTISFFSDYQVIRATGRIVPLTNTTGIASRSFHQSGDGQVELTEFKGIIAIENVEPGPLVLTRVSRRWLVDGEEQAPNASQLEVTVPPGEKKTLTLSLGDPPSARATGVLVIVEGSCGRLPVMFEQWFELRTSQSTGALLTHWRDHLTTVPDVHGAVLSAAAALDPGLVSGDKLTGRGAWLVSRLSELSTAPVVLKPVRQIAPDPAPEPVQEWKIKPTRPQLWSKLKEVIVEPASSSSPHLSPIARVRQGERRIVLPERRGTEAGPFARLNVSLDRLLRDQASFDKAIPIKPSFEFHLPNLGETVSLPKVQHGGPMEGAPCDPDAMSDDVPEGWVCQFAGSYTDKMLPDRVMNAKKGDLFLSPGGSGTIGGLLKQVTPSQRYDHCGFFSKDRIEVCHATGSASWLSTESGAFPSDGLNPSALKYLWPGSIIQSVGEGVRGSKFWDPKKEEYNLSAFNRGQTGLFGAEWSLIPPLVVKPVPTEETAEVRSKLHAIADIALGTAVTGPLTEGGQQSKRHYRFFLYTQGDLSDPAPNGEGWATGTIPAVCSQFIWRCSRDAGVDHFEADLEAEDEEAGWQRRSSDPDGLYFYTKEERATAAKWLFDTKLDEISKTVEESAWESGAVEAVAELFTDIADDISNQLLNTFAYDDASEDAKDSSRWEDEPRDGVAVSPDDILHWDSPSNRGLWGFSQRMDVRPSRPEKVPNYAWRRTQGPGLLQGNVTFKDAPIAGVEVKAGGKVAITDAAGGFEFELFEGPYVLDAGVHIDGFGYCEAHQEVTVKFKDTVNVSVALVEPPDAYRELTIWGTGTMRDDEDWTSDESSDVGFVHVFQVEPYRSHDEWTFTQGLGDEILVDLAFKADLGFDHSVTLTCNGYFYEGTDEDREDLDMQENWSFNLAPGETRTVAVHLWNKDEDVGDDNFKINLTMTNNRQP